MFQRALAIGDVGGGEPQINAEYGFTPHSSRVEYKSGSFYVNSGVCYVDAIYTVKTAMTAGQTVFGAGTKCAVASSQGTTATSLGDITVKYNSSETEQFHVLNNASVGTELHFVGNFKTTAVNTKPTT